MSDLIIAKPTRAERMEQALIDLSVPIPSTKGLGPKDRAELLHAELTRRIALAKEGRKYEVGETA